MKMIKKETDCYYGFVCPYNAKSHEECEQWCGLDENGEAWVPSNFDEDEDGW